MLTLTAQEYIDFFFGTFFAATAVADEETEQMNVCIFLIVIEWYSDGKNDCRRFWAVRRIAIYCLGKLNIFKWLRKYFHISILPKQSL